MHGRRPLRARVLATVGLAGITGAALFAASDGASAAVGCGPMSSLVFQRSTGATDLITPWSTEAAAAAVNFGFAQDHGTPFAVGLTANTALVPIGRFFSAARTDFAWATDAQAKVLTDAGYVRQKTDFHAAAANDTSGCRVPVSVFTQGGKHRYASTAAEKSALAAGGWVDGGVVFWAGRNADPTAPTSTSATGTAPATSTAPASPTASTTTTTKPPTTSSAPTLSPSATKATSATAASTPTATPSGPAGAPAVDTVFGLAVIPDTQNEMYGTNPTFVNRAKWLVANRQQLDLRHVIHTGDIVSWDDADHTQFKRAQAGFQVLSAAGVPWMASAGNHDTAAVCPGGSSCTGNPAYPNAPATSVAVRDTRSYNTYVQPGMAIAGRFEAGKAENSYSLFTAGGVKWMVLSLEFMPRTEAVTWAKSVVDAHKTTNVIISTHMCIDPSGAISGGNDGYGANSPQYLWANLIKVSPNVKLVLNGHIGGEGFREDTTNAGSKVIFLNGTWHSSVNITRLVDIDTAAGKLSSRWYTPDTGASLPDLDRTFTGLSFVR